jgi:hypothetical protein
VPSRAAPSRDGGGEPGEEDPPLQIESGAVGAAGDVGLQKDLPEGVLLVVPVDDDAAALGLEHDVHEGLLGRHLPDLGHLFHQLPVHLRIGHSEPNVVPADVGEIGRLGDEVPGDALALVGMAQAFEHRFSPTLLGPGRDVSRQNP